MPLKPESHPTTPPTTHAPYYHPEALLRLSQIIGNPKANPPILPLYPVSRSSFYQGIKDGIYPSPIKCPNSKLSFWTYRSIKELIDSLGNEGVK